MQKRDPYTDTRFKLGGVKSSNGGDATVQSNGKPKNNDSNNPKGELQEKILALGLGFTANDIRYRHWQEGARWLAELNLTSGDDLQFQAWGNSIRTAERKVATLALADWAMVKDMLEEIVHAAYPPLASSAGQAMVAAGTATTNGNGRPHRRRLRNEKHQDLAIRIDRLLERQDSVIRQQEARRACPPSPRGNGSHSPRDTEIAMVETVASMFEQGGRLIQQGLMLIQEARALELKHKARRQQTPLAGPTQSPANGASDPGTTAVKSSRETSE